MHGVDSRHGLGTPVVLSVMLVFVGAGAGGVLRYALAEAIHGPAGFPLGTLVVNVAGCLAVGFLHAMFAESAVRAEVRVALFVGVLGGFTTFSAFARETLVLLEDRAFALAGLNVLASNVLCLGGAWIGLRVGERIFGPAAASI